MGIATAKTKMRQMGSKIGSLLESGWVVPVRRGTRVLGVSLAALSVMGATAHVTVDSVTALPDDVAYRVGDANTTKQVLERRVNLLTAFYGIQRPEDPAKQDQFIRDTAKAVVVSDLLGSAAEQRGIKIGDKAASDELDKFIQQSYPNGRQEFVEKLGQLGVSQDDVLAEIKRQRTNAQLYQQVTKDVPPVSDQELPKAFEERKAELVVPEQRHLRNMVLGSEQEANDVLRKARSGQDFAELARNSSLDGSTKQQGGDLGTVSAEQLEGDYGKAAFAAEPNGVFGPARTQHGWNIGQVVEIKPAKPLTFDEVKDDLRKKLEVERKAKVWSDWLAGLINSIDIEYADMYRPANPNDPPNIAP